MTQLLLTQKRNHQRSPVMCAFWFALVLLPSLAWPLNKDARQAYKQGQRAVKSESWTEAKRYFEQAQKIEPSWSKPLESLIRLKLDRRIAPLKIAMDLARFTKLKPNSYKRWLFEARLAHQQGQLKQAVELYTKTLAKRPNTLTALIHRADLQMQLGEFERSLVDYEKVLGLRSNHKDARWGQILALVSLERWTDAHIAVVALRASFPENGALLRLHQTISQRGLFPPPTLPKRPKIQYRELPPSEDAP